MRHARNKSILSPFRFFYNVQWYGDADGTYSYIETITFKNCSMSRHLPKIFKYTYFYFYLLNYLNSSFIYLALNENRESKQPLNTQLKVSDPNVKRTHHVANISHAHKLCSNQNTFATWRLSFQPFVVNESWIFHVVLNTKCIFYNVFI